MSYGIVTDDRADAVEVMCCRLSDQRQNLFLVRPADLDILLSFMQELGFVCGTKEVKVDQAVLDEYAVDVTQF